MASTNNLRTLTFLSEVCLAQAFGRLVLLALSERDDNKDEYGHDIGKHTEDLLGPAAQSDIEEYPVE